jgi:uncharacterized membrane protein
MPINDINLSPQDALDILHKALLEMGQKEEEMRKIQLSFKVDKENATLLLPTINHLMTGITDRFDEVRSQVEKLSNKIEHNCQQAEVNQKLTTQTLELIKAQQTSEENFQTESVIDRKQINIRQLTEKEQTEENKKDINNLKLQQRGFLYGFLGLGLLSISNFVLCILSLLYLFH